MEALPVDAAISEDTPSTSTQQGECARGLRRIFESHVHPPIYIVHSTAFILFILLFSLWQLLPGANALPCSKLL